jgi:hypothetical protein
MIASRFTSGVPCCTCSEHMDSVRYARLLGGDDWLCETCKDIYAEERAYDGQPNGDPVTTEMFADALAKARGEA